MRVLTVGNMYPPHHLGGYELMWRSSVRHLRDHAHEVRVLTTDYRNPSPDGDMHEEPEVHRDLRWYWRDHAWPRLTPRGRLRLERHNLAVLDQHLRDFRPDAVAWWAMGGMSMSLIERARLAGVPGAAAVVDDWLLYGPSEDQWQRMWRLAGPLKWAVGKLSGVPTGISFDDEMTWLAVSETIAERARAGGWRLPDLKVVHAGIDQELFVERPRLPWRGELLYVGRIDPRKGVHTAVEALVSLPDMRLTVIGGGDDEHLRDLHGQVKELGVEDRVSFERRERRELVAAYAEADALLFPVVWDEPFGLVPLEAMAVGAPVVATGTGGSGEYLCDGANCLLFERGDAAALATRILRLRDDPALRERLRAGGLATAAGLGESLFNDAVEAAIGRAVR